MSPAYPHGGAMPGADEALIVMHDLRVYALDGDVVLEQTSAGAPARFVFAPHQAAELVGAILEALAANFYALFEYDARGTLEFVLRDVIKWVDQHYPPAASS